jgi:prepilin-type N-terminal cleavage/methylation domain-containing protein
MAVQRRRPPAQAFPPSVDNRDVSPRRDLSSQSGFTLIEVLVAMTIMLSGTVGAMALIDRANAATVTTKSREAATTLARELIESVRTVPYDRLTDTNLLSSLAAQPGLGDSAPGGAYTIRRRDVTFTITGSVCVMDDARDGAGDQSGGGFCPGSATGVTTPVDRNPEDYKKATVTVAWSRDGYARSVTQTAILNNPGAAGGPSVSSITTTNTTLPVYSSSLSAINLSITTSRLATTVNWMLDGTVQAPAPTGDGSGVNWSAAWDLTGVEDGTYVIAAEAFDAAGLSGPTRQLTVQINRFTPKAPSGVSAGRNRFGHVEIEWAGNSERDVIGYAVYRGATLVCALETIGMRTECVDETPPAVSDGPVVYTVYAHDVAPDGSTRPSETPGSATAIADNVAPEAPVALRKGVDGFTLTWDKPSPEDAGPAGDGVHYYRVYRDGRTYAHRYARWFDDGSTVSWADPSPTAASHTYWVTAVDTHYMESEMVGGVTVP